jgi:hypothetical protein
MFPDGRRGVLLLFMRLTIGTLLVLIWFQLHPKNIWTAVPLGLATGGLFLGIFTRIIASISAVVLGVCAALIGQITGAVVALHLVNVAGIVLLGAGAYSLDAQIFGRQVVHLRD